LRDLAASPSDEFLKRRTKSANPAAEGSQFRGSNGPAFSASIDLPLSLDQARTLFGDALPPGHSSPVLIAIVFSPPPTRRSRCEDYSSGFCLDRQTGKQLWQREVPRTITGRLQNVNGPASPSPVTDGTNVVVFFQEPGMASKHTRRKHARRCLDHSTCSGGFDFTNSRG
jgi:hypothetical protein